MRGAGEVEDTNVPLAGVGQLFTEALLHLAPVAIKHRTPEKQDVIELILVGRLHLVHLS
jgi:hypothetical protein